mmetsp:Transcript_18346/g.42299  ORF Transcript_18346/g.42299 Transcript_18346/m.42299 type:complete len:484 (-) Transcript_18346:14-1465(-)
MEGHIERLGHRHGAKPSLDRGRGRHHDVAHRESRQSEAAIYGHDGVRIEVPVARTAGRAHPGGQKTGGRGPGGGAGGRRRKVQKRHRRSVVLRERSNAAAKSELLGWLAGALQEQGRVREREHRRRRIPGGPKEKDDPPQPGVGGGLPEVQADRRHHRAGRRVPSRQRAGTQHLRQVEHLGGVQDRRVDRVARRRRRVDLHEDLHQPRGDLPRVRELPEAQLPRPLGDRPVRPVLRVLPGGGLRRAVPEPVRAGHRAGLPGPEVLPHVAGEARGQGAPGRLPLRHAVRPGPAQRRPGLDGHEDRELRGDARRRRQGHRPGIGHADRGLPRGLLPRGLPAGVRGRLPGGGRTLLRAGHQLRRLVAGHADARAIERAGVLRRKDAGPDHQGAPGHGGNEDGRRAGFRRCLRLRRRPPQGPDQAVPPKRRREAAEHVPDPGASLLPGGQPVRLVAVAGFSAQPRSPLFRSGSDPALSSARSPCEKQ